LANLLAAAKGSVPASSGTPPPVGIANPSAACEPRAKHSRASSSDDVSVLAWAEFSFAVLSHLAVATRVALALLTVPLTPLAYIVRRFLTIAPVRIARRGFEVVAVGMSFVLIPSGLYAATDSLPPRYHPRSQPSTLKNAWMSSRRLTANSPEIVLNRRGWSTKSARIRKPFSIGCATTPSWRPIREP
jgi:hypothetical protein